MVSYKVAEADWKLTISDNGIGKPDVKASQSKPGLGTSLIQALARQLDANVNIVSDSHGTAVSMTHATFKAKPSQAVKKVLVPAEEISERVNELRGNNAWNMRGSNAYCHCVDHEL